VTSLPAGYDTEIGERGARLKGRTTVADRLSTVRSADRILVTQNGGVVEAGRSHELLKHGHPCHGSRRVGWRHGHALSHLIAKRENGYDRNLRGLPTHDTRIVAVALIYNQPSSLLDSRNLLDNYTPSLRDLPHGAV